MIAIIKYTKWTKIQSVSILSRNSMKLRHKWWQIYNFCRIYVAKVVHILNHQPANGNNKVLLKNLHWRKLRRARRNIYNNWVSHSLLLLGHRINYCSRNCCKIVARFQQIINCRVWVLILVLISCLRSKDLGRKAKFISLLLLVYTRFRKIMRFSTISLLSDFYLF